MTDLFFRRYLVGAFISLKEKNIQILYFVNVSKIVYWLMIIIFWLFFELKFDNQKFTH